MQCSVLLLLCKAISLPTSQTEYTLAKNKTYELTLEQTKDILAETLDIKTEGQNWLVKYNILNQARQQFF